MSASSASPQPSPGAGRARILVLGAGVSGLSCAHELLERGHAVTLWARDEALATTSGVAAALWYPFEAGPPEKIESWASRSLTRFGGLLRQGVPGLAMEPLIDLRSPAILPRWVLELEGHQPLSGEDLRGFEQGWLGRVPIIETPLYLPWLQGRVRELGGRFEHRSVSSLDETKGFEVVVNCTGLGARELCADPECYPIRGQIAQVPRDSIERAMVFQYADGRFGYVVPRSKDCVLGGTAEHGVDSLEIDVGTTQSILESCRALEPRLPGRATGARAGLRPGRKEIRLGREDLPDGRPLIHNYGHGGCGVTLSWGCAEDVLALTSEALA